MKYTYLFLLGLLALAPATYAESTGNTDQLSINQTGNITVKGQIVDEKGEPIVGATVQQSGKTNGTIANLNGEFSLSVPSSTTLVVSYVGCKKQEVAVENKTDLGKILDLGIWPCNLLVSQHLACA